MWPFKKKTFPPRSELTLTDSWDVCHGTDSGKPLILRINRGVGSAVRHPEFRHQVGVATLLREPDTNGFPSPAEQQELEQLEDRLIQLLAGERETIHVATLTTGGMREFVFYTANPQAVQNKVEHLIEETDGRVIQGIVQYDPHWKVYRRLA